MSKIAVVPKEPPPSDPPPLEIAPDDPRYFFLSEPISVAGKTIDKLLIDSSALKGPVYFKLATRFRMEHPDVYRTSFNKFGEEIFLSYVVAELNPPMIFDDLQKLDFNDLPMLFLRMQSFLYAGQAAKTAARNQAQRNETL